VCVYTDRQIHTQEGGFIRLFLFFQKKIFKKKKKKKKESGLKHSSTDRIMAAVLAKS
jgi:hypothetical protein